MDVSELLDRLLKENKYRIDELIKSRQCVEAKIDEAQFQQDKLERWENEIDIIKKAEREVVKS